MYVAEVVVYIEEYMLFVIVNVGQSFRPDNPYCKLNFRDPSIFMINYLICSVQFTELSSGILMVPQI